MQTADLITAFLNNEMTAEQERQFLLSVAASDSLRLGLKSHVMVDRIFQKQLTEASVPVGVKSKIFTEMSASLGQSPSTPGASTPGMPSAGQIAAQKGFLSSLAAKLSGGLLAASLAVGGFAAGYMVHSELNEGRAPQTYGSSIPNTPRDESRAMSVPAPSTQLRQRTDAAAPIVEPRSVAAAEQAYRAGRTVEHRAVPAESAAGELGTTRHVNVDNVSQPAVSTPGGVEAPAGGITSPGVPSQQKPPTGTQVQEGTVENPASVQGVIRRSTPEDRRKAQQQEDQGMP